MSPDHITNQPGSKIGQQGNFRDNTFNNYDPNKRHDDAAIAFSGAVQAFQKQAIDHWDSRLPLARTLDIADLYAAYEAVEEAGRRVRVVSPARAKAVNKVESACLPVFNAIAPPPDSPTFESDFGSFHTHVMPALMYALIEFEHTPAQ